MIFKRAPGEERWEGWWEPEASSSSPDLHGKIEWDKHEDGRTTAHLMVGKLDLPDGATVEAVAEDEVVMSGRVENGKANELLNSAEGDQVPELARKEVELRHDAVVLARTVLEPD